MNQITHDANLIRELGGPTKLAATLADGRKVSPQRVQNWLTRGIPSHIKVAYPHIFMRGATQDAPSASVAPVASESVAQGV